MQAALDVALALGRAGPRGTGPHPDRGDRRWAGSAAASWATPATPTCCSCTTRTREPTSATPPRPRTRSCGELRRLLAVPSPDPPLVVDADLRPEGRQGPLVRTPGVLRAPTTSGGRWSGRARRCCGPSRWPATRSWARGSSTLVDPLRYRDGGIAEADVREIRRIKARVEAERLPRGADPHRHTKLGPGGLADVEWTVQLLQLRHACASCPGCGRPGPWGARGGRGRRAAQPGAGPGAAPTPGGPPAGCATRRCWCAGAPATRCPPICAS